MSNLRHHFNHNKHVIVEMTIGDRFNYNASNNRQTIVKFIRTTPKGFNFLDEQYHKLINIKSQLYIDKKFNNGKKYLSYIKQPLQVIVPTWIFARLGDRIYD